VYEISIRFLLVLKFLVLNKCVQEWAYNLKGRGKGFKAGAEMAG
jgi:hypothetical protein